MKAISHLKPKNYKLKRYKEKSITEEQAKELANKYYKL